MCGLAVTTAEPGDETALSASSPEEQATLDRALAGGPGTYGTQDSIIFQIPSAAFTPCGSSTNYIAHTDGCILLHEAAADHGAFAPVNLPNGAQIRWVDVWYDDASLSGEGQASLHRNCDDNPPTHTLLATVDTSGSDSGYGDEAIWLGSSLTIDNHCQHIVYVTGLSQGSALQFLKIEAVDLCATSR